ncbi:putative quinol monooxygenase [Deinococcus sp.]|uniref:putative quinol monooxygenase n=1 Tax=Deinococcus sp. TaxID=47478 RepID=UPI003CC5A18E
MVISLGYITVPVQHEGSVVKMLTDLAAQTRTEPGCLAYHVSRDLDAPGRFLITEYWASLEQMQTHLALPHIGPAVQALQGMGVTELSITAYQAGEPMQMM